MLTAFLEVGQQVLFLLIFLIIGFVFGKVKLSNDQASISISNLALYVVVPASVLVSFQDESAPEKIGVFFVVIFVTVVLHFLHVGAAKLFINEKDPRRCRSLEFATVFPNSCFIGYPLMAAMVGSVGVLYGSAYVATSIFLIWTYGIYMLSGDKNKFSLRSGFLNPGVLSVVISLFFYLAQIKLPTFIVSALTSLSVLNVPLPMFVIGYHLSKANFKTLFRHNGFWISTLLRLVVLPLVTLVFVLLLPIRREAAISIVIASAAPAAAVTGMFAEKFGNDTDFASGLTATQTAISIVSIPVIVGVAQYLIV